MSALLTVTKPICPKRMPIFMSSHRQRSEMKFTAYTARINTHEIGLKIDTGAKCNVLPLDLFKKVQKKETINKAKAVNLVAYGGERFSTLGTADLQCKIGDTTRLLTFQVLDRQATPILGLNDALQLNLVKLDKAVYEVDADAEDAFRQQVVTEYADLLDDQLGNLAARYTMSVDKSVTPVVNPARKIPQTKEELGNMVEKSVIVRETELTEWVSQIWEIQVPPHVLWHQQSIKGVPASHRTTF